MRALLSKEPGGPHTLVVDEAPEPIAGPGQVRVRVRACGLNYPDTLIIEDRYQFKPERPFAPGGEVSGVVDAVGENVTGVRVGDHVIATSLWGGMAEKVVFEQHRCIVIPKDMPFEDAAALLLTFGTSYYALKTRGQLRAGETTLVLGAAGGIGLASVSLAKALNSRVVAAVSSTEKSRAARDAGADEVVIYPRELPPRSRKLLTDEFKAASGANGADVIVDAVGGPYAEAALRAVAWDGRFLVVGFPAGIPQIPLNLALLKSCQIVGVFWGAWIDREPRQFAESAGELLQLYQRNLIKPMISAIFPLASAAEGFRKLSDRTAIGKLVVTM